MQPLRLGLVAALSLIPVSLVPTTRHAAAPQEAAPLEELIAEKSPACSPFDEEDVASRDGRRVAWRAPGAGGWSVMVNGVAAGATYEKVRSLMFSPDGQHLAFAAKKDRRWTLVTDGKEDNATYADIGRPLFSDDGTRLAFSARPAKKWVMVIDGDTAGGEFDDIHARRFSPDGRRLAFVGRRGDKFVVVVDGKEGPPFNIVGGMTFSADSRRFAYAGANVRQGFGKQKATGRVVIDGVAGEEFEGAQVGGLLKSMATGSTPHLMTGYFPQLSSDLHGVTAPAFSPDGTRVAYAARRGEEDSVVMLDAKPGAPFAAILDGPVFSHDGQQTAAVISDGTSHWLVLNGEKVGPPAPRDIDFFTGLVFAPGNRSVAYAGVRGGSMYDQGYTVRAKRRVYVDGVPGAEYNAKFLGRLEFTPDGAHLAFVVGGLSENSRDVAFVVVDGVEGKRYGDILGSVRADPEGQSLSYTAQSGRRFYRVTRPLRLTVPDVPADPSR